MAKNILVIKSENQLVPQPYLKKVIEATGKAWGYMFITPASGTLVGSGSNVPPLAVEVVNNMQKTLEKVNSVFWFSDQEVKDKLDQQPFSLFLTQDDKPLLLGMAAGDFTGIIQEGSADSPVLQYMRDHLYPKLSDTLELLGGDVTKLTSYIREKENYRKELLASCKEHGAVVFMDSFGIPIPAFLTPSNQSQYLWGWTTDSLGYTGKETEEAKPVAAKGGFQKLGAVQAAANQNKAPAPVAPTPTATAVKPTGEKVLMVRITFPPKASRNDRISIVRRMFNGDLNKVPNYKDVNAFYIPMERAKALQTLGMLDGFDAKEVEIEREPQLLPSLQPETTPAQPAVAPAQPAAPPPSPEREAADMVIDADAAKRLSELMKDPAIKREIDESGNLIMNPQAMKERTSLYAPFFGKAGLKHIHQTIAFGPDTLLKIVKISPMALRVHCMNLAAQLVYANAEIRRLEELIPVVKEEPKPAATGTKGGFQKRAM